MFDSVQSGSRSHFSVVLLSLISALVLAVAPIHASWDSTGGTVEDASWGGDTTAPSGDDNVGALAGQGGVSGGAATYSIPIVVPPGRNGVQPSVSLNYSSRSGNGIAGMGWGMSAGSSIHRCSSTAAQDGTTKAVTYATTDKLCLDGQRLVVVSGVYGTNGAEYRTEQESFAKIVQSLGINSASSSFTVYYKDGSINHYGSDAQSRHSADGKTEILTWAIAESEDRSGNNIQYDYGTYGAGEHLLEAIHYTGFNGSEGDRHVRFVYEARPDDSTSYLAGGLTRSTQRLSKVQTEYQSTQVREYQLTYSVSDFSKRSFVDSITECAQGVCLPATTVDVYNPQLTWGGVDPTNPPQETTLGDLNDGDRIEYMDLNGDGVPELIHTGVDYLHPSNDFSPDGEYGSQIYKLNANGEYELVATHPWVTGAGMRAGDLNGDGLTDFFAVGVDNKLVITQYDQNFNLQTIFNSLTLTNIPPYVKTQSAIDVNADGYQDVLFQDGSGNIVYYENTATDTLGFTGPHTMTSLGTNYSLVPYNFLYEGVSPMDLDGDGVLDLMKTRVTSPSASQITVEFGTLTSAGHWAIDVTKSDSAMNLPGNHYRNEYAFADINGDGLQDFVRTVKDSTGQFVWRVHFNEGDRSFKTAQTMNTSLGIHEHEVAMAVAELTDTSYVDRVQSLWGGARFADIDNDGADELVVPTHTDDHSCAAFTSPGYLDAYGHLVTLPHGEPLFLMACDDDIHTQREIIPQGFDPVAYEHLGMAVNWSKYDMRRYKWSVVDFGVDGNGSVQVRSTESDVFHAPLGGQLGQHYSNMIYHDFDLSRRFDGLSFSDLDNDGNLDASYRTRDGYRYPQTGNGDILFAGQFYTQAVMAVSFEPGTPPIHTGYYEHKNLTGQGSDLGKLADAAYQVTDALANVSKWNYAPLSRAMTRNGSVFYDVPDAINDRYVQADSERRHFYFTSSMQVVSDYWQSNGIGGENQTQYSYREAVYNRIGRGIQGFRSIIVDDLESGLRSVSDFHQIFPMAGKLEQVRSCLIDNGDVNDPYDPECDDADNVISKTEYRWNLWRDGVLSQSIDTVDTDFSSVVFEGTSTDNRYWIAPQTQTEYQYSTASSYIPAHGDLQPITVGSSLLYKKYAYQTFNTHGCQISSETTYDENGSNKNESITATTYKPADETDWWLCKTDEQTVTTNAVDSPGSDYANRDVNSDHQKVVTTTYTWNETHRKPSLVDTEVQAGGGRPTKVHTEYNAHGLPVLVRVEGSAYNSTHYNLGARETTTTYTTDGYFIETITNAKGHQTATITDAKHGLPLQVTDPNNQVATTSYDVFGRVKSSKAPGEPTQWMAYSWCNGINGGTIACADANTSKYRIYTKQNGAPNIFSYLDSLNRQTRQYVRNFANDNYIHTRRVYNSRGLVSLESVPRDMGDASSSWQYTHYDGYDNLGRLTRKRSPQSDGADYDNPGAGTNMQTNYVYDGFETTINVTHGGETLAMKRKYNGLQQLVWTQDAAGEFTRYAYDGAGNPITVQDPLGNTITTRFNALGQKEWVDDPNAGYKSFEYNSLGELEREVDANGDELTYRYDVLGRMERRWLNSSLMGMWFYDSTASYGRKGMLDKEVSTDTNDPDRFEKYYRYDTTGDGKDYLKYTNNRIYEDGASAHHYTFFYVDNNYGRPTGMRYGDTNLSIQYEYNSLGYLTHIKNAHSSGYVYREITELDGLGNMTGAMLGNAMYTQSQRHHLATGQMLKNRVTQQGSQVHHELAYDYGAFSNLSQSQVTVSTGDQNYEMYEYDSLHRLIKSERAFMEPAQANDVITYNYNELGNLVYKSDYGQTYAYGNGNANGQTAKTAGGNAGPNAIRALTRTANAGGGNTSYTYDNNGNMKTGDGRSLDYNVFNKPIQIIKNSVTTQFSYGADLMRYKQVKTNLPSEYGSTTQTTYYVDKHLEIEEQGTRTVYRHYIDGIAILNKEVDNGNTQWKLGFNFKDRLGSVVTVGDDQGNVIEHRSYDPFGKPRSGDFVTPTNTIKEAIEADPHAASTDMDPHTDRGFTDHEHLDEVQLIHMNGRVYDYNIGRFTSVDPFIQGEGNSQGINPYSYILNNPLAGTDPTGYIVQASIFCGSSPGECAAFLSGGVASGSKGNVEYANAADTTVTVNLKDGSKKSDDLASIGTENIESIEITNTGSNQSNRLQSVGSGISSQLEVTKPPVPETASHKGQDFPGSGVYNFEFDEQVLFATKAGTADQQDAELVNAELKKIPYKIQKYLKEIGVKIYAVRNSVTEFYPDLKGVQPRGWPSGKVWDDVHGAAKGKEVVIAIVGHGTKSGPSLATASHRSFNIVLHEVVHPMDNRSSSVYFKVARQRDWGGLSGYQKQVGDAGLQETYAESFANVFGGNANYKNTHPNLYKYWMDQK